MLQLNVTQNVTQLSNDSKGFSASTVTMLHFTIFGIFLHIRLFFAFLGVTVTCYMLHLIINYLDVFGVTLV